MNSIFILIHQQNLLIKQQQKHKKGDADFKGKNSIIIKGRHILSITTRLFCYHQYLVKILNSNPSVDIK